MSVFVAALLLSAGPAAVPAAPAQSTFVAPPAKPEKEKKVCKADPTETGSRLVKRICLTQDEWDHRGRTVDEMNAAPTSR
jgi:hypothetical protein